MTVRTDFTNDSPSLLDCQELACVKRCGGRPLPDGEGLTPADIVHGLRVWLAVATPYQLKRRRRWVRLHHMSDRTFRPAPRPYAHLV